MLCWQFIYPVPNHSQGITSSIFKNKTIFCKSWFKKNYTLIRLLRMKVLSCYRSGFILQKYNRVWVYGENFQLHCRAYTISVFLLSILHIHKNKQICTKSSPCQQHSYIYFRFHHKLQSIIYMVFSNWKITIMLIWFGFKSYILILCNNIRVTKNFSQY